MTNMGMQEVLASDIGRYALGYCFAIFVPIALAIFLAGVAYGRAHK